jgi:hypothetical protein
MRLDLLGCRQFRGQEVVADVLEGGRLQDRARAERDGDVGSAPTSVRSDSRSSRGSVRP